MKYTCMTLILAGAAWASPDEIVEPPRDTATKEPAQPDQADTLLTAAKLRERVRGMRKDVLGGGPAVEKSEKEALRFYRRKLEKLARRTDELATQRDMKDAEYNVALDATLTAEDPSERDQAARDANRLRRETREIELEIGTLERQGETLGRGLAAIQKRMDQRKRLLSRFDQPAGIEELPYLGDEVLGLEEEAEGGQDPFMDEELFQDLMQRDPKRAKELLFRHHPERYWKLFPLKPPPKEIKDALQFPPSDLPGKR